MPESTKLVCCNPILNEIIGVKHRIIVLNKSDLASDIENKKWLEYYRSIDQVAVLTNSSQGNGVRNVVDAFFSAEFEGGRHVARIDKISAIEKKYNK